MRWLAFFICALAIFMAQPAAAGLGDHKTAIAGDSSRLHATISRQTTSLYEASRLDLPIGTHVAEFAGADGKVFAVSWNGPVRPNLQVLLGSYYPRFQADATASRIRMRGGMASTHADFVVRTGGRPGYFWGYAFLPGEVPAGFSMRDLN